MAKPQQILGMNGRNQPFVGLNSKKAKRAANSKLISKRVLTQENVPVPILYKVISSQDKLKKTKFSTIPTSFVVKPSGGSGGKGILIVRRPKNFRDFWLDIEGNQLKEEDIRLHISDILEGQYSTFSTVNRAFIEERVALHPTFKKYVVSGTPDIRVIVYNSVPVMAMLRLPTKESEGRANLHQGGIGLGIDIGSGVTLSGVQHGKRIKYLPDTKLKLNGIKIPNWDHVLEVAIEAANAINLNYAGVDLLLHPEKGPVVIELNARPGLAIQLANGQGLRFRLNKVEGLSIRNTRHGIRVGKALFTEIFTDKVKANEGIVIIPSFDGIKVKSSDKKLVEVLAVFDTSAYRTSIDHSLAERLGLLEPNNVLWTRKIGRVENPVVSARLIIHRRTVDSAAVVVNRSKNKTKIAVGRLDLVGFYIDPGFTSNN